MSNDYLNEEAEKQGLLLEVLGGRIKNKIEKEKDPVVLKKQLALLDALFVGKSFNQNQKKTIHEAILLVEGRLKDVDVETDNVTKAVENFLRTFDRFVPALLKIVGPNGKSKHTVEGLQKMRESAERQLHSVSDLTTSGLSDLSLALSASESPSGIYGQIVAGVTRDGDIGLSLRNEFRKALIEASQEAIKIKE